MKWKKLGLLIEPSNDYYWMSSHVGPSFIEVIANDITIYITGRDKNNVSRIGTATLELDNEKFSIKKISKDVLFDIGKLGTFDENGVSYPWLIKHNGNIYMYYVGWVNGGRNRYQVFTGLAISKDQGKSFNRVKNVPVLERTHQEPVGSGSCCVFIEDDIWKMYYTAYDDWEYFEGKNKPHYNIKFACSKDGINWLREGKIIIDYNSLQENVIGKPMIIKENGLYKLWYSYRGESFRIGYAESTDGLNYIRKDHEAGIDVSASGWDSEMIEYGFIFDYKNNRYMIYNGNQFGKTGLGLAILEK